jgi:hypothetical protein
VALEFGFGFGRVLNPKLPSLSLSFRLYTAFISPGSRKPPFSVPLYFQRKTRGEEAIYSYSETSFFIN